MAQSKATGEDAQHAAKTQGKTQVSDEEGQLDPLAEIKKFVARRKSFRQLREGYAPLRAEQDRRENRGRALLGSRA